MKTRGEVEVLLHAFLVLALDGCEWRPGSFTSGCSFDRRLGGPHNRSGRGGEEKKFPAPADNQTTVVQPLS
jgi:hypothetical protein